MNLGEYTVGDTLTFTCQTRNAAGTPTDADAVPSYRVYEDNTATPLLTGNMALLDGSNTDGFYSAQLTLLAANGFEVGKSYTIRILAIVGGQSGVAQRFFQVTNTPSTVGTVPSGYPTTADLTDRFEDAGIAALSTGLMTSILNQVVGMWEKMTGYKPFLNADSDETTRLYDPPGPQRMRQFRASGGGRLLDLRAGLLSLTSVTVQDVAYTVGTNVFLRPNNAIVEGRPYTELEFVGSVWGQPQSVEVTGVFGFCTALPSEVWEAILQEAFARASVFAELKISGGAQKWTEGDVTEDFGKNPLLSSITPLTDYFMQVLTAYILPEV